MKARGSVTDIPKLTRNCRRDRPLVAGCRASRSHPSPAAPRTCTRGSRRSRRTNSLRSPRSSALARSSRMLHPDLAAAAAPHYCGPRRVGRPRRADKPVANSICTAGRCSRKGVGSTTRFALRFRTCSTTCATIAAAPRRCSATRSSAPRSSVHRSSSGGAPQQARLSCATATAGAKAALRTAPAVGRPHGHAQRARRRQRHRAARKVRTARHRARHSRR